MQRLGAYFKTTILLAALTALLVIAGYYIGGRGGAILFFFFSLIMNVGSYWFSDKIALRMSGSKPLSESEAPEIHQMVDNLARKMGIPKPKVYVSPNPQPNAFATGRNPKNSAVSFTSGILKMLNRDELEGVTAHELAHIKNYDVLISTVAAVIAGTISSLSHIFMFGGGNRENRNPLLDLALIFIAPIAASLIQLGISRTREYSADATGASYTKRPDALADALIKIHNGASQIPMDVNPALSSLYIENPFVGMRNFDLFSTHPSMEKRVRKLRGM